MVAIKLSKHDGITTSFQSVSDSPAAAIDWENVIMRSMRDEESWFTIRNPLDYETWREGHDALKEIAIDEPKGNSISGSIRKTTDRNPVWVDGHAFEYSFEREIQK